jgi:hypothetical protein
MGAEAWIGVAGLVLAVVISLLGWYGGRRSRHESQESTPTITPSVDPGRARAFEDLLSLTTALERAVTAYGHAALSKSADILSPEHSILNPYGGASKRALRSKSVSRKRDEAKVVLDELCAAAEFLRMRHGDGVEREVNCLVNAATALWIGAGDPQPEYERRHDAFTDAIRGLSERARSIGIFP